MLGRSAASLLAALLLPLGACAGPAASSSAAPPPSAPQPAGTAPATTPPAPDTPATTPRPATAAPEAVVPRAFLGSWTGDVTQIGDPDSPYPVIIHIQPGALGDTIGTADYAKLNCKTHWLLRAVDEPTVQVREVVDRGNCVTVDVSLTLRPDGTIAYAFDSPAHGRAVLTR